MQKIPLIVVVGATASGKTSLAVNIAKKFNGEVISADSMQIYKHMEIATAKPTIEEMQGVKHHLVDFLELTEKFSVADYVKLANEKVSEIIARKKIPIIAGGTGLYISSLIDNIQFNEIKTDLKLRQELYDFAKTNGANSLWKKLFEIDEETALKIHENNIPRVARAIEIYKLTGVKMSQHVKKSKTTPSQYDAIKIGINYNNRQNLYNRINKRVDIMLENGLIAEAKEILFNKNLITDNTAFQAIGYKELMPYFSNEIPLEMAIENIKKESRHYAKRQLTWFRRDEKIKWFCVDNEDENENLQEMQKNIYFYIDNFLKMWYD